MTRLGQTGESAAARYLQLHGYKILEKNFRSRFGEIDIVAQKNETVVFVEVKTAVAVRWILRALQLMFLSKENS